MLRINAEPGFFTEIFTELKACGISNSNNQNNNPNGMTCGTAWRSRHPREVVVRLSIAGQHQKYQHQTSLQELSSVVWEPITIRPTIHRSTLVWRIQQQKNDYTELCTVNRKIQKPKRKRKEYTHSDSNVYLNVNRAYKCHKIDIKRKKQIA